MRPSPSYSICSSTKACAWAARPVSMLRERSRWLVSTDWLASRLSAPDVVVLDGSYYLATMKRDAEAEYLAGRIPGAVRFDIDKVADRTVPLPHMIPSAEQFAAAVGALGIGTT